MSHLVVLCHDPSWERLYQAVSCAASAAAQELRVDLVFYFGALRKLAEHRLDEFERPELEAAALSLGTPSLTALLAQARAGGAVRVHACSAALALEQLDVEALRAQVDAVVGWPTVLRWIDEGARVIYL